MVLLKVELRGWMRVTMLVAMKVTHWAVHSVEL